MYISAIQPIQELYMHHVKAIYIINREKLTQVLRDELLAVVHDEDSAHVELDVVLLLLVLKEVKGGTTGHEEEGTELQLPFH